MHALYVFLTVPVGRDCKLILALPWGHASSVAIALPSNADKPECKRVPSSSPYEGSGSETRVQPMSNLFCTQEWWAHIMKYLSAHAMMAAVCPLAFIL